MVVAVLCGWEGNSRSGIEPAKCHRLRRISIYGLCGLRKGYEHPAYALQDYGILYLIIQYHTCT